MTDDEIAELVYKEFSEKTLGTTEQYLEIHQPVYQNGAIKIERIDRETFADTIVVYIPVESEYFFFAVYINIHKKEISNVGTLSRNIVMLRVTSETLTINQMGALTQLNPDKAWNKGDLKRDGKGIHKFSCLEFIPNPEPGELSYKLDKLLTFIEADRDGIFLLGQKANVYVDVTMDYHYGNQLIGNIFIDIATIKRMNDLNLKINIDIAAWGEPFRSHVI